MEGSHHHHYHHSEFPTHQSAAEGDEIPEPPSDLDIEWYLQNCCPKDTRLPAPEGYHWCSTTVCDNFFLNSPRGPQVCKTHGKLVTPSGLAKLWRALYKREMKKRKMNKAIVEVKGLQPMQPPTPQSAAFLAHPTHASMPLQQAASPAQTHPVLSPMPSHTSLTSLPPHTFHSSGGYGAPMEVEQQSLHAATTATSSSFHPSSTVPCHPHLHPQAATAAASSSSSSFYPTNGMASSHHHPYPHLFPAPPTASMPPASTSSYNSPMAPRLPRSCAAAAARAPATTAAARASASVFSTSMGLATAMDVDGGMDLEDFAGHGSVEMPWMPQTHVVCSSSRAEGSAFKRDGGLITSDAVIVEEAAKRGSVLIAGVGSKDGGLLMEASVQLHDKPVPQIVYSKEKCSYVQTLDEHAKDAIGVTIRFAKEYLVVVVRPALFPHRSKADVLQDLEKYMDLHFGLRDSFVVGDSLGLGLFLELLRVVFKVNLFGIVATGILTTRGDLLAVQGSHHKALAATLLDVLIYPAANKEEVEEALAGHPRAPQLTRKPVASVKDVLLVLAERFYPDPTEQQDAKERVSRRHEEFMNNSISGRVYTCYGEYQEVITHVDAIFRKKAPTDEEVSHVIISGAPAEDVRQLLVKNIERIFKACLLSVNPRDCVRVWVNDDGNFVSVDDGAVLDLEVNIGHLGENDRIKNSLTLDLAVIGALWEAVVRVPLDERAGRPKFVLNGGVKWDGVVESSGFNTLGRFGTRGNFWDIFPCLEYAPEEVRARCTFIFDERTKTLVKSTKHRNSCYKVEGVGNAGSELLRKMGFEGIMLDEEEEGGQGAQGGGPHQVDFPLEIAHGEPTEVGIHLVPKPWEKSVLSDKIHEGLQKSIAAIKSHTAVSTDGNVVTRGESRRAHKAAVAAAAVADADALGVAGCRFESFSEKSEFPKKCTFQPANITDEVMNKALKKKGHYGLGFETQTAEKKRHRTTKIFEAAIDEIKKLCEPSGVLKGLAPFSVIINHTPPRSDAKVSAHHDPEAYFAIAGYTPNGKVNLILRESKIGAIKYRFRLQPGQLYVLIFKGTREYVHEVEAPQGGVDRDVFLVRFVKEELIDEIIGDV